MEHLPNAGPDRPARLCPYRRPWWRLQRRTGAADAEIVGEPVACARLEEAVGAVLVERSTRHLRLTDAGLLLRRHANRILDDVGEAENAIGGLVGAPRGDSARQRARSRSQSGHWRRCCQAFLARYPDVRIVLTVDNRNIDLLTEEIDVVIRIGPLVQFRPDRAAARQLSSYGPVPARPMWNGTRHASQDRAISPAHMRSSLIRIGSAGSGGSSSRSGGVTEVELRFRWLSSPSRLSCGRCCWGEPGSVGFRISMRPKPSQRRFADPPVAGLVERRGGGARAVSLAIAAFRPRCACSSMPWSNTWAIRRRDRDR